MEVGYIKCSDDAFALSVMTHFSLSGPVFAWCWIDIRFFSGTHSSLHECVQLQSRRSRVKWFQDMSAVC